MQYFVLIFFIQYAIFYAEAIIGYNLKYVESGEYLNVACFAKQPIEDLRYTRLCTGIFISNFHILTADHCLQNVEIGFVVYAGSNMLAQSFQYFPFWWISYDKWTNIFGINDTYPNNDIAIVRVMRDLTNLSPHATLTELLQIRPFSAIAGFNVNMVGCGLTNEGIYAMTKLKASLKVLSTEECESRIERIYGHRLILTDRLMCTVGEPYTLLGDGDSGSPTFYFNYLVGIGLSICPITNDDFHPDRVNLHLILSFYTNFITEILNN